MDKRKNLAVLSAVVIAVISIATALGYGELAAEIRAAICA